MLNGRKNLSHVKEHKFAHAPSPLASGALDLAVGRLDICEAIPTNIRARFTLVKQRGIS
jgi:hypothetical protein